MPKTLQRRLAFALTLLVTCAMAPKAALPYNVTLRNFFGSMTFPRVIQMSPYPGEDSAYVVVQQAGKLVTVRWTEGAWKKTDSATINVLGGTFSISEQGLLGVAFHPNFRQNRKYYLYYIAPGTGNGFDQIVERIADSTMRPKTGDAQRTILKLVDPYDNHNGSTIRFGKDGFLYFAIGDGGSLQKDPQNRSQNLDSLFGKFMRLDVSGTDDFPSDTTKNYAIPADNPFVGQGTRRPEIWAYGLRNPFRWAFHPVTGDIWVGDVGQDYIEEVSRVPKGGNMGWKIREGNSCFNTNNVNTPLTTCEFSGMAPSALDVLQPTAQAIIGGEFFYGNPASAFHGAYFFGDYQTDSLWAVRFSGDSAVERIRIGSLNAVSSFNRDLQGRILATSVDNGTINILESPDMVPAAVSAYGRKTVGSPNPALQRISRSELIRNRDLYEIKTLNGRISSGVPNGIFWVSRKGAPGSAILMSGVRE